jgi:hypothetical protein
MGFLQNGIDEIERYDLRQLTQMTGGEPALSHGELARDGGQAERQGTMTCGATEYLDDEQSWRIT